MKCQRLNGGRSVGFNSTSTAKTGGGGQPPPDCFLPVVIDAKHALCRLFGQQGVEDLRSAKAEMVLQTPHIPAFTYENEPEHVAFVQIYSNCRQMSRLLGVRPVQTLRLQWNGFHRQVLRQQLEQPRSGSTWKLCLTRFENLLLQ